MGTRRSGEEVRELRTQAPVQDKKEIWIQDAPRAIRAVDGWLSRLGNLNRAPRRWQWEAGRAVRDLPDWTSRRSGTNSARTRCVDDAQKLGYSQIPQPPGHQRR